MIATVTTRRARIGRKPPGEKPAPQALDGSALAVRIGELDMPSSIPAT
jgi:hypothetical protein